MLLAPLQTDGLGLSRPFICFTAKKGKQLDMIGIGHKHVYAFHTLDETKQEHI